MGTQHSNMNNRPPWDQDECLSAFSSDYLGVCYQTQFNRSHIMHRLDSVGEDTNTAGTDHFQTLHHRPKENSVKKIVVDLSDNPLKTSYRFRAAQNSANLFSPSRSLPIPSRSRSKSYSDGTKNLINGKNCPKFLKSNSFPEVPVSNSKSNLSVSAMMKVDHKLNRSWSVGSSGEKLNLHKCQPLAVSVDESVQFPKKHSLLCAVSGSCTPSGLRAMGCACNSNSHSFRPHIETKKDFCRPKGGSKMNKLSEEELLLSPSSSHQERKHSSTIFSAEKFPSVEISPNDTNMADDAGGERSSSEHSLSSPSMISHINDKENQHVTPSSLLQSSHSNLSSILSSPRKTCKKGRPSSKKQKKRQREKQRHASKVPDSSSYTPKTNVNSCGGDSNSCSVIFSNNNTDTRSNDNQLSQKISTPVKPVSQHTSMHWFFSNAASSESEESESDEEEGADIDSWSFKDESDSTCLSPINGCGFSFALNLDSIFKQKHIPSLKSLLTSDSEDDSESGSPSKQNGMRVSVSVSLSDDNDSIEFADVLPNVRHLVVQETIPISPESKSQEETFSLAVELQLLDANAKWDKAYSTQDACSCCSKNSSEANGSVIKVQFVEGPSLSTVYAVGDEDRAGIWHHFALDRKRFEKRIHEVSQVLSPVLEVAHRCAIVKRNACLLEQHGDSLGLGANE